MTERIKQDINALVEQPRQPRTLPPVEPVGGIPAERGVSVYQASGGGGGGGGIASPLTEPDYGQREYYESRVVPSDFLIGLEVRQVKRIIMKDANDEEIVFNYDYDRN